MQLRTLLISFLVWILYPAWLLAGAADYFCHRRSDIDHTSGSTESWLHVAQFLCIGTILVIAVEFFVAALTWTLMLLAAVAHSVLSYVDVAYSYRRRRISAFEQHIHGYLDVIPLVAVGLLAVISWQSIVAAEPPQPLISGERSGSIGAMVLLASFALLAGVPVLEELIRTLRARRDSAVSTSAWRPSDGTRGPATGKR